MGIELEVAAAAQTLNDSPFAKDAGRSLKKLWKRQWIHSPLKRPAIVGQLPCIRAKGVDHAALFFGG